MNRESERREKKVIEEKIKGERGEESDRDAEGEEEKKGRRWR